MAFWQLEVYQPRPCPFCDMYMPQRCQISETSLHSIQHTEAKLPNGYRLHTYVDAASQLRASIEILFVVVPHYNKHIVIYRPMTVSQARRRHNRLCSILWRARDIHRDLNCGDKSVQLDAFARLWWRWTNTSAWEESRKTVTAYYADVS